ncbi:MAG: hypothetical protein ACR5K7_01915 [Symbiopectobacterium sp.]
MPSFLVLYLRSPQRLYFIKGRADVVVAALWAGDITGYGEYLSYARYGESG